MTVKNMEKEIKKYFSKYDFDLRKRKKNKKVPRFTDQKCTPDILQFISFIILDWVENGNNKWNVSFKTDTGNSLWHHSLFSEIFQNIYGKPNPLYESENEYDKILSHPNVQLVYAEILEREKKGRAFSYNIKNDTAKKILEFIATSENNAFIFQNILYDKVSKESNFTKHLTKYKKNDHTEKEKIKKSYKKIKDDFYKLLKKNTAINNNDECGRIFAKFLNNYAIRWHIRGSKEGRPTNFIPSSFAQLETRGLLYYNQENWYDKWLKKDKNITRKIGKSQNKKQKKSLRQFTTKVNAAKKKIRKMYETSEHEDKFNITSGLDTHHIFLSSEFPQYADCIENIIKITGSQHRRAHLVNGKTKYGEAEKKYQKKLLKSKLKSIEDSKKNNKKDYSKEKFIEILNVGLNLKIPKNASFAKIRRILS